MPLYLLACPQGHQRSAFRSIADRNQASACPECGQAEGRDFVGEMHTITIAYVPRSFYTQWGDLYDVSPRELAKNKDIERFDPSMPVSPQGSARKALPKVKMQLPTRDEVAEYIRTEPERRAPVPEEALLA